MNAAQQQLTAISWVAGDDTGASSMTIWSVMMGAEPQGRYGSAGAWPAAARCYAVARSYAAPAAMRALPSPRGKQQHDG